MVDVEPPAIVTPVAPMTMLTTAPAPAPRLGGPPSLVTATALGPGNWGMSLGGGYSIILPLYVFELGYGLSRRVDLAFRYETISGLFHYPQLAVRWAFAEIGAWSFGARLGVNYSLFAVSSAQTDLTSTLYLSGEVLVSRPVTRSTDLVAAFRTDFDLWELRQTDGSRHAEGTYRFDAIVPRVGARTQATTDLSIYVLTNLRVPIETFTYKAEQFLVLPSIEAGGTFVW